MTDENVRDNIPRPVARGLVTRRTKLKTISDLRRNVIVRVTPGAERREE